MIKLPSIHLNTEYSLLQSTIKIDDMINLAVKEGLKELVITDRDNMYAVADFVFKCKKNGIKPIIGLDIYVEGYRFIFLAKNYDGYKELTKLSSIKEKNMELKMVDISDIDLFVIDHPTEGFIAKENRQPNFNNFYLGSTTSTEANAIWFKETKILNKEDNEALNILAAIKDGSKTKNNWEPLQINLDENDPKVAQAKIVIEACNVEFPDDLNPLPPFPIETQEEKETFFKRILNEKFSKAKIDKNKIDEYKKRINYEVKIIVKLDFIDYFLIIWDLISWSKEQGISIGPGRGSSAGSLISYLLGITEVDPIKFDLLFERFLNPERVSMPDIDIDIQDNRREDVVQYLFDKYGHDNVALISTFTTIGAKTALRDVARVMGLPLRDVDSISKLVPTDTSLKLSYEKSVRFRAAVDKTPEMKNLFNKAKLIEGLPRQKGTHAAGIVISDSNLVNKVPVTFSNDNHNQVQYSMTHLESFGLLKIDLLGLRNLTTIQIIQKEIWNNYKKKVDLFKIPLYDEATNKLLSCGDTNGVFQLESYGMKKTLIQVGVSNFDDIVSIISLFRPGPMEFIPEYISVKKGEKKIACIHPSYDKIVSKTKGIIIYQEQIMKIAQDVSKMSFGQADILRRAISKKNLSLISSLKDKFLMGAKENGLTDEQALKVYLNIEKFANYGFNKSHAVSYGLLAYRIAFLKARFPFEFYSALIKSSVGSQTQVQKYTKEAKSKNIKVNAPSINESKDSVFNKGDKIVLPLTIIKGFGDVANKKLLEARNECEYFKDFFDFVLRVKRIGLGVSQITSLIQAGALREFHNIKTLLDSLPSAVRYADMVTQKDGSILDLPKPLLIKQERDIIFEMRSEAKSLGFNLSIFPTTGKELKDNLTNIKIGTPTEVVALIENIKTIIDKNGNKMGIIKISDSLETIEMMAFDDVFKFIEDTKKGKVVKFIISKKEFKGRDSYTILKPWEVI